MTIAEQFRQEVIEKGRYEAKIEMARQCLADGVDRAVVKTSVALPDTEINSLRKL